jgi:hypothetical protein
MRAIHFNETAHHFSSYVSHHPFQFAAEAVIATLLILSVSSLLIQASETGPSVPTVTKASAEPASKAPAKWVWAKRVDRGGHLYPVGL